MDFTNGFRELLGIRVLDCGDGEAMLTIDPVPEELLQSRGIVHGGVYATLVDSAAGQALRPDLAPGEALATIDLSLSYLRPTSGALLAHGRLLKRGRSVAFCTAEVLAPDGTLLATGRVSISIRRSEG